VLFRSLLIFLLSIAFLNAEDKEFKKIFEYHKIEGTLLITTLKSNELYIYNKKRADLRFTAASTFKIPHTLIALNEELIKKESDIIKWDGIKRGYELWNKDQTLQSAISVSCVWCYKQFTKKISKEKYIDYLSKFNYGNKTVGKDKSSFWLNGDLRISAYEQIDFLKKLYNYNLPVKSSYINIVKKILTVDKNGKYELRAKSGWDGTTGWYVGYLEKGKKTYFFAMNGKIKRDQLGLREKIVKEAFRAKKIIDPR
jgi:beta-lactamase class D